MVMRYGSRIWKLRVLQAELKMTIRSAFYGFLKPTLYIIFKFHPRFLLQIILAVCYAVLTYTYYN